MRREILYLTLLLAACLCLTEAAPGASTLPSGVENPMPVAFPQLLKAPAPSWLDEGSRATYGVMSSSSDVEYGQGIDWSGGSAGYGLLQSDVVALEGRTAAVHTASYTPGSQGAMRPLTSSGSVASAGCGDFWCSPDVLQEIPERAEDDLTIQRLPVTIGGEEYSAIRFDFRADTLEMALVYDLETGVLLYHTLDYTSYGREAQRVTTSWGSHVIMELKNLRKVDVPWRDGQMPSWIRAGRTLSYQGETSIQVQGASPYSFPLTLQTRITEVHDRFIETLDEAASQDQSAPARVVGVSGISRLMGGFVPAEALGLQPGVIDEDPDTGMSVAVRESGEEGIYIQMTNGVDFLEVFGYDSEGRLALIYQEFNPDVMTSVGFGSAKTVSARLVDES